jgi:Cys-rich protein (TIGR01571 family)
MFRIIRGGGHNVGREYLDSPLSNFDTVGVPTGSWFDGLCIPFFNPSNWFPSSFVACFCPCIMFSTVTVRAQIPLLIALKNSTSCMRGKSGYGFFIDYFVWSLVFAGCILVTLLVLPDLSSFAVTALVILLLIVLLPFVLALGHQRTAFKEKYRIPGMLPEGSEVFDMILDFPTAIVCMPCSLAQMARHVMQYDLMVS